MYQVVDWEQDEADRWRIRVAIEGQTAMFKFLEWPDDEAVQAEAARYHAAMIAARAQMAAEVLNDAAANTD